MLRSMRGMAVLFLGIAATISALAASHFAAATPTPMRVSNPASHSLAPDLAIGPKGDINLIWLDKTPMEQAAAAAEQHESMAHTPGMQMDRHLSFMDMYFSRSTDAGKKFSAPVRVNAESGLVWGFSVSKPKVAVSRSGVIHIAFPANAASHLDGKSVLVMMYTRSIDGGNSFEKPRLLHQVPKIDQSKFMDGGFTSAHAFGTLAVAPDNSVHAIWVDTRDWTTVAGAGSAYTAVSRDDGVSFTTEVAALPVDVCPCCQITLAFDSASNMYIGARQVTNDGHRNSTIGVAVKGSNVVSQRSRSFQQAWKLDGCPLKPTVVAIDGQTVYTAAYNGGASPSGVYLAVSADGGKSFAAEQALHPGAALSDAPAITRITDGVLLAWHGKTVGGKRVFYRTVRAGGASLGKITALAAPEGVAQLPAVGSLPDGRVQIAWQQGDSIYTSTIAAPSSTRLAIN